MTHSTPPRVAVVGLGGFAQTHHQALWALEREGLCRVAATCDPQPDAFSEVRAKWQFEARGVAVYDDYRKLLDAEGDALDLVTLPVPIPLHAEMHRACVERGIAAYLEKPPSLDPAEFAEMLRVERRARRATAIGFHMMADPLRLSLKERIARGEFGRVRRVSFLGLWPRSSAYYRRNDWAGRLQIGGRLVLDSCVGNAMAHYVNNLCHWAGDDAARAWRDVETVEAEMYRAHPIEGTDTVFARGRFVGGAELRLAASHACAGGQKQREIVECERATIVYVSPQEAYLRFSGRTEERLTQPHLDLWRASLKRGIEYVGGAAEAPCQRLSESAPYVAFHTLLYAAAGSIRSVRPPEAVVSHNDKGEVFVAIDGIEAAAETLAREGRLPSETGRPWAAPGGAATRDDAGRLREIVARMARDGAREPAAHLY